MFIDTGPLVALIDRRESHHPWALSALDRLKGPLHTCQAVMTETFFLLREHPSLLATFRTLMAQGGILDAFDFAELAPAAMSLMERYHNVPMSFADACLVAMSETYRNAKICTLDRDFQIYRRHGHQSLDLVAPFAM
jgi:predicted nucleic acid-binding protein